MVIQKEYPDGLSRIIFMLEFQCDHPEEFIRWVIQNYNVHSGGLNRLVFQFDHFQRFSKWIIQICGLDKLSWDPLFLCIIQLFYPNWSSKCIIRKKVFRSFKLYYPNVKNRNLTALNSHYPDLRTHSPANQSVATKRTLIGAAIR